MTLLDHWGDLAVLVIVAALGPDLFLRDKMLNIIQTQGSDIRLNFLFP